MKLNKILVGLLALALILSSLAAFAVSAYMEKLGQNRRHLTTMSFNRSSFLIKPLAD